MRECVYVCVLCACCFFFFSSAPLFILLLNKDAFKKKKKEKAEVLTCTLCRGKETGVNTKHSVQSSKKKTARRFAYLSIPIEALPPWMKSSKKKKGEF